MTYETTEQEAGELTALAAIKRHYPIIAGRAMQLQQAGEDKAALAWAAVAGDFYTVLAAKKAPQLSGVISSSQIEDFFNIWHRGGPGVNGSVFEWVARRVNETLSTKEPNTLPVPELAAKRIHDAIERGYSKWEAANCSDPSCGCVAVFIEREVLPLLAENTLGAGELTALDVRDALLAAGYGTVRTPLNADATPEIVRLLNAALAEKAPDVVDERSKRIECALRGILGIGKRDTRNPKYDGYYTEARAALGVDSPPAPTDKRPELEQEYGQDHPWPEFDNWHKEFHEIASGGGIAWPCVKPLRCFWRWTRKSGATVNQNGIVVERATPAPHLDPWDEKHTIDSLSPREHEMQSRIEQLEKERATPAPGAERLREALERCLIFMESIKLVDAEEFDAHGLKWAASRWRFDVKERGDAIKAVREALAAAPPPSTGEKP